MGGAPTGCQSNGSCATGGCNRLNASDWLADLPLPEDQRFDIVEVSFHNGSRKAFYRNPAHADVMTGDLVAVESDTGFDVGRISLSGELVKMRIKQSKGHRERRRRDFRRVLRRARDKDLELLTEARAREGAVMIQARRIAREMNYPMKIGDVDFQADGRKATFYYTADTRIDFRELVRVFAGEFRIKIDMRQIGARQEAGQIGGIGTCGRELCCSTWLTEFKTVSTAAARYQNLAINQDKLSGQCGRLKCCLNYELDTYMEAVKSLPKASKRIKTVEGEAYLVKTDVLRLRMHYRVVANPDADSYALDPDKVRELLAMNKKGELAPPLSGLAIEDERLEEEAVEFVEEAHVSLRTLERSSRKHGRKGKGGGKGGGRSGGDRPRGEGRGRSGEKDAGDKPTKRGGKGNRGGRGKNKPGDEAGRNPSNSSQAGGSAPRSGGEGDASKRRSRKRGGKGRGGRRGGGSGGSGDRPNGGGQGGSSGGGQGGSSGGGE
jgi:cell fate regulator YaaT (PSP1 superfamily)